MSSLNACAASLQMSERQDATLLLFGVALYCIEPGHLTFELWNVLAQLSFTYLVAFLMMQRPAWMQISFTFLLLAISEILYRAWSVPGFDQPFVPDHNFGSYIDMMLMGKLLMPGRGCWTQRVLV